MPVIVSANYHDRSQKNWLVRQEDDPIDKYELFDSVAIKDFKFCESYSGEAGFGCNVVAVGGLSQVSDFDRSQLVRLFFDGVAFRREEDKRRVTEGLALVLDQTGMYYLPS